MVRKIAHVGIATNSIAEAARFYELLGLRVNWAEIHTDQKVKAAFLSVGESALELLEATEPDSPIARFLKKRGAGLHHITLEVEEIEEELRKLRENDIALINETPVRGADGSLVAFIHPSSTGGVLVELSQSVEGDG
jgi:methylmalonyl-CoA epimerase